MPLQGLMLILISIIIIPILIVFGNPDIFFILISIILIFTSLKNVYNKFFKPIAASIEADEDVTEEFEQTLNVDVKKFKTGINVSKNLIIILFFIYCTFLASDFKLKAIIALVITHRISNIYYFFNRVNHQPDPILIKEFKSFFPLLMDLLTVIIIFLLFFKNN